MFELTALHYLLLGVVSVLGGMLTAISGGGGMIMLPTLLMTGMPPQLALGTNKLYTTANLASASYCFMRRKLFSPSMWWAVIIATLTGSVAGAILATVISEDLLAKFIPFCMLGLCIYLILPNKKVAPEKNTPIQRNNTLSKKITTSLLGIYSGFIGVAGACIWMAVAGNVFKLETLEAAAMSRFMCMIANAVALLVFIALHQVDYFVGVMLVATGILGAQIGSKLCLKYGHRLIRPMLLASTFLMTSKLIYDNWLLALVN